MPIYKQTLLLKVDSVILTLQFTKTLNFREFGCASNEKNTKNAILSSLMLVNCRFF